MAKWTVPDDKDFTIQAKITKAMQRTGLNVDEVIKAIDKYHDDKCFDEDLHRAYLASKE